MSAGSSHQITRQIVIFIVTNRDDLRLAAHKGEVTAGIRLAHAAKRMLLPSLLFPCTAFYGNEVGFRVAINFPAVSPGEPRSHQVTYIYARSMSLCGLLSGHALPDYPPQSLPRNQPQHSAPHRTHAWVAGWSSGTPRFQGQTNGLLGVVWEIFINAVLLSLLSGV